MVATGVTVYAILMTTAKDRVPAVAFAAILEAITLPVQMLVMFATMPAITIPDIGVTRVTAEVLIKSRRGQVWRDVGHARVVGFTVSRVAVIVTPIAMMTDRLGKCIRLGSLYVLQCECGIKVDLVVGLRH